MKYHEYITSCATGARIRRAWRNWRPRAFAAVFAMTTALTVRSRFTTAPTRNLGNEQPGDLTTLCHSCHRVVTDHLRRLRYALRLPAYADIRPALECSAPLFDPTFKETLQCLSNAFASASAASALF